MTRILAILILSAVLQCHDSHAADLALENGMIYRNYTVSSVNKDSISITHSDGIARIEYTKLPAQLRQEYFPNGTPTPTPAPQPTPTPETSDLGEKYALLDPIRISAYAFSERFLGISRVKISDDNIILGLLFAVLVGFIVLMLFKSLIESWLHRNESKDERDDRKRIKQIKNSRLGMGMSVCVAMYFLFYYDTTVSTERQSAQYYEGIEIVPAIPSIRVHNLERANFQRNMILIFLAIGIFHGFRLLSASRA